MQNEGSRTRTEECHSKGLVITLHIKLHLKTISKNELIITKSISCVANGKLCVQISTRNILYFIYSMIYDGFNTSQYQSALNSNDC